LAFGDQPTWLIHQALTAGERLVLEQAARDEMGIAQLNAFFYNCNRDPKKTKPLSSEDFKHHAMVLERIYEKPKFPPLVADTIKTLVRRGLITPWIQRMLNMELIDRYSTGGPGIDRGCYQFYNPQLGTGVAIFNPQIKKPRIYADYAILGEGIKGPIPLYVIGTRIKVCEVVINTDGKECQLTNDVQFDLVGGYD